MAPCPHLPRPIPRGRGTVFRTLLVLIVLALSGVLPASAAAAQPGPDGMTRHSFGNSSGTREYLLSRPPGAGPVALIVFLHGCGAAPQDYGLHRLAATRGIAVAYPVQSTTADAAGCWNWRNAGDRSRGAGEPSIIAGITGEIVGRDGIDPARVFVAGHSAGAGMVANMAAAYPDLYAAAGLFAGCGGLSCADVTGRTAFREMGSRARPVPAFMAWGTADTVNPYPTGRIQLLQWLAMNDLADDGRTNLSVPRIPTSHRNRPAVQVERYDDRRGCAAVRFTTVVGGGHVLDFADPAAFPAMIDHLLAHPMRPHC